MVKYSHSYYIYEIMVEHKGLKKFHVLRGKDKYVLEQKAEALKAQWEEMWQRKLCASQ